MKIHHNLRDVRDNIPLVHNAIRSGLTHEQIIVAMANERERLVARLFELESYAPKKMIMPDGTVMVWHCPDELVPLPNGAVSRDL